MSDDMAYLLTTPQPPPDLERRLVARHLPLLHGLIDEGFSEADAQQLVKHWLAAPNVQSVPQPSLLVGANGWASGEGNDPGLGAA